MNIFLTSSFAEVVGLFVSFTRGECSGKTVTLIPTASLVEEVNSYLLAAKDALAKAGLVIDELDVSSASRDEIVSKLERGDYIYVDFYPLPHYRNEPFAEAVEQVLKEHGDALDLRPFSNNQAIVLSGGHAELQTCGD